MKDKKLMKEKLIKANENEKTFDVNRQKVGKSVKRYDEYYENFWNKLRKSILELSPNDIEILLQGFDNCELYPQDKLYSKCYKRMLKTLISLELKSECK